MLALNSPVQPGLIPGLRQPVIKRCVEVAVGTEVRELGATQNGSPQYDAAESIASDRLQAATRLLD
jgi:hypothetical protein